MSKLNMRLQGALLILLPADGTPVGNTALCRVAEAMLQAEGLVVSETDYWQAHADLVAKGALRKGQGRGGSVRLANGMSEDFSLAEQIAPPIESAKSKASSPVKVSAPPAKRATDESPQIISYHHQDKRKNNPEVGRKRQPPTREPGGLRSSPRPTTPAEVN